MSTPPPALPGARRGPSRLKLAFWLLIVPLALAAAYFAVVLSWSYSDGERAGWVQKFSKKGWLCKTWEGEMALVTMPGAIPEKFLFTVRDGKVAEQINRVVGKRVSLHYEEKVGLPTTCFGETRHFVTSVTAVDDFPFAPPSTGVNPGQPAAATPPVSPATAPVAPSAPRPTPSPPSEYTLPAPVEATPPPAPAAPPATK
jgi:hypothetical protein